MNLENKPTSPKDLIKSTNEFSVVGIGASAGGLEAFKKFIIGIPDNSGMAYVLVQHLDPSHASLLPELLQKVTKIPVQEISDDLKVQPNNIYIIPSNKMLIANDGILELSPRPEKSVNRTNMPIDLFFSSLAEIHQTHAIGVVLSGTATDGTLGLKAIKDHGGITFAQDEDSAEFDGMPTNAIRAGVVDFTLPPEEISKRILDIKNKVMLSDEALINLPKQEEDIYKQTLALLRIRKGTDFTFYKQPTIRRRILRRVALTGKETSEEYLKYLRENKSEQDILYQDLLIPVTDFFRDHKIFDNLCETVFPEILKNKPYEKPIRIWLAGCSTGQEAYSVAICLKECLGDRSNRVQIFATDISDIAIAKARSGIYKKNEISGLSTYRLAEYFTEKDGNFQINKSLRDMCVFAMHNFLKDPPFGNIDLVACRNVLIYMEPYLQKKALTTFHYALAPKGYLLLGKSESVNPVPELFSVEAHKDKLYVRKNTPSRFMHVATVRNEERLHYESMGIEVENLAIDFQKTADEIMLTKYTPAGVVVNNAMDIVQYRGATGQYLEQASGKPSHNVLKLAKSGLAFELRNILLKVKKQQKTIIKKNIPLDGDLFLNLEALQLPNILEPHFLILFHPSDTMTTEVTHTSILKGSSGNHAYKDIRIKQLEMELAQIREDMRSVTEDQEAANEELQSANEELLSSSEELQSLNEELETGKEELQSTNEELTVVNQEMITMNEQLTEAGDYTQNIIATLREPLLALDNKMLVKSANKAFYKIFGGSAEDTEGISVFDIGNREWNIPALQKLFNEILPERKSLVNYEVTFDLPNVGKRIMLLNAREMAPLKSGEVLILIVLEDVTERLQIQQKEIELLNRFKNLVTYAPVAVCIVKGNDYTVDLANNFYLKMVEKGEEIIGSPLLKAVPELNNIGMRPKLDDTMQTGSRQYGHEVELEITRNNNTQKAYFDFVYQPMIESDQSVSGIIIVASDVTDQVKYREKMESQATMIYNLLMTAPGFVCTLEGPKHVYNLVNDRYQQLFGERKIKDKPIMEALPELEGQNIDLLLNKVYTTGEPYVGIEVPITLARDVDLKPEVRYFNFSYQPMFDENKIINSILVFGYEVTEEVTAKNKISELQLAHSTELEENIQLRTAQLLTANIELIDKNDQLLRVNKELESFNYVSSHDLQEPLRKIQLFAARILENGNGELSTSQKDDFLRIQASAWRMQTLILDLLSYSKAGNIGVQFEKMNLSHIVDEAKDILSEIISEKKAIIDVDNLCDVEIDQAQFRQVFTNLLSNALKFVKPNLPPHIRISARSGTGNELGIKELISDEKYCHISFKDNGIGINDLYQNKIFEVFQRLHTKDQFSGTGIGLAIVKKIVEKHNGLITVTSKIGKGSTFHIYIPAS